MTCSWHIALTIVLAECTVGLQGTAHKLYTHKICVVNGSMGVQTNISFLYEYIYIISDSNNNTRMPLTIVQ